MTTPILAGRTQPEWDAVLADRHEIADYIESVASDYVDHDVIEEYFRGQKAVLRLVPIETLEPGDPNANIPSRSKERQYAKLPPETMPPLVVQNGSIEDGNHRYRVAKRRGDTALWCYVIENCE